MNVTFVIEKKQSEKIKKYRNKKNFKKEIAAITLDVATIENPITAKFYQTKKTIYCCVWINELNLVGASKIDALTPLAETVALEKALNDCGITFEERLTAFGKNGIVTGIKTILKKMGYEKIMIRETYP
jgi:hypothetical protein